MPHLCAWFLSASVLLGFSGSGLESYQEALKYLGLSRRMTPDDAQTIDKMEKVDRLGKAIELLKDAYSNATSDRETEETTKLLGRTYNLRAIEHSNQNDFSSATEDAQEAVKYVGKDWVVLDNLSYFQFKTGDYAGAAQTLSQAKDVAPTDADKEKILRELAVADQKVGEAGTASAYDDAIDAIQSISGYDQNFDLLLQLGEIEFLKGDESKALAAWEKAQAIKDLPAGIAQKYKDLEAAQQIKQDKGFTREKAQHFTVDFDDKANAKLADKFLGMLDDAWNDVGVKFSLFPKQTFYVTIYMSSDYVRAGALPWSAAQAHENRIEIRVAPGETDERYADVIHHEFTHTLVYLMSGARSVPTWFNEGIAMHSEIHPDMTPFNRLLDLALKKKHKYIAFEKLEHGFDGLPSKKHIILAYAQGYSVVDRMIDRFGFASVLKILQHIAQDEDFPTAFQSVTTVRWKDFEQEWFEATSSGPDEPDFSGLEKGSRSPRPAPSPAPSVSSGVR